MKKSTMGKSARQAMFLSLIIGVTLTLAFFSLAGAHQWSKTNSFQMDSDLLKSISLPLDYETQLQKGDIYLDQGKNDKALKEFLLASELNPEFPEAYHKMGQAYMNLRDNKKAEAAFGKALLLSPENSNIGANLALVILRQNRKDEAMETLQKFDQANKEILYATLIFQNFNGDMKGMNESLKKLKEANYDSEKTKYFEKVERLFSQQIEGQEIYLKALSSEAFLQIGEYELAEYLAYETLNLEPDYRDVWTLFGYAKLKLEKWSEAEDAFAQARNLDSTQAETHYFLGMTQFLQGKYNEAVKSYELSLLHGFSPEIVLYRQIAESQLSMGKYTEALDAYEQVLNIDAQNINDFVKPIWISLESVKDLDRAFSLSQKAVDEHPKDAMAYNLLGWVYLEQNKLKEAEIELNKSFAINSNLSASLYNLARLKEAENDIPSAIEFYDRAIKSAEADDAIEFMSKTALERLQNAKLQSTNE